MPKYVAYDKEGKVTRLLDVPADELQIQLVEGEDAIEGTAKFHDTVDVAQRVVVPGKAPIERAAPSVADYVVKRRHLYPAVTEQLDMLWHSMDAGEIPKAGAFYERILQVKEAVPKPEEVK